MTPSPKILFAAVVVTITFGAGALPVFAETTNTTTPTPNTRGGGMGMMGLGVDLSRITPSVFGSVTAKNGTILTIKDGRSGTLYTVETSGAKIQNAEIVGTLSDIAVGDRVRAEGTITGSSVVATRVIKYRIIQGPPRDRTSMMGERGSSTPTGVTGTGTAAVSSGVNGKDLASTTVGAKNSRNVETPRRGFMGTISHFFARLFGF